MRNEYTKLNETLLLLNTGSTYNPDSLIKYPGFNAPVPDGVNDDHKLLRMPPLMQHQQLDFATSTMKTPKPVPYKRLKITSEAQSPDGESEKQDSESNSLTSKEILKQIEEREAANPSSSSASSPASKVVCTGAQVPESYKVKKPPLEKWSENNSLAELVFFENLPNYTGVFDRMRSVLGGVRTKLFGSQTSSSVSAAEQMSETKNQAAEVKTDTEPPVILLTDSDDDGKESDGEDDGKSDK